jgi:hypothetical protein
MPVKSSSARPYAWNNSRTENRFWLQLTLETIMKNRQVISMLT